jgi:regulator of RNase E activity RraA
VDINIPIKLGSSAQDAVVRPGDFVLADVDGVVLIPGEVVEQVLESVPGIVSANDKCADAIRSGMSVQDAFATYRGKSKA